MKPSPYLRSTLPLLAALLLAAGLCYKSYRSPHYNWDMLCYVGNALAAGQPEAELHRQVYALAAARLPAPAYAELTGEGVDQSYRRTLRLDSAAFAQTRPLFGQRVLYVWAIRLLHWCGADPFQASVAINALAVFAICACSLWWLRPYVAGWWLPLGFAPFFFALQWNDIARLSSPDSLAAALCLGALYLVFERRRWLGLALGFLIAAILARTEAVILGGMVVAWLALPGTDEPRLKPAAALLWLAALGGTLFSVGHFYPSYHWRLLISYCFLKHQPFPSEVPFTATDYALLLARKVRVLLNAPEHLLLLTAWALALLQAWSRPIFRPERDLLLLLGLNLVTRFCLFPALDYRYHLILVAATTVAGLRIFAALLPSSRSNGLAMGSVR